MNNCILAFSSGVDIFLTLIIIAAAVALIFLTRRSISRIRTDNIEADANAEFTAEKFDAFMQRKIESRRKTSFTIFQIEIQDSQNLKKTYGEMQYESAINSHITRIKELLNTTFKVFKYSSDSIFVYSKLAVGGTQLNDLSKRIIIECQKTIVLAGALTLETDVNVGIVTYPGCGNTAQEIRQNLLIALVTAKRKGFNTYAVYDAQIGNKQSEEYKYYTEIQNAINNKEFTLYYQPVVNLQTKAVYGAEALIRWEHKTMGTLSPASFLPIMEKSGDINWVGFWSLEQLIKQHLQWKNQYPDREILLSMNLSPKQLLNTSLIDELRRIIRRSKVQTKDFVMEIVQFAMFEKVETVTENIKKLSQMGFKIALDNFGMEFSTLQMLDDYKIDFIKLDRTFINDSLTKEMTKNIFNMLIKYASDKQIAIVAEGVENQELLDYVIEKDIMYGQGYHFSKAKKPQEFIQDVILTPWN